MKEELISVLKMSWPIMTIVLAIILIIRIAYYKNSNKKFHLQNEIMLILFGAYILILFQLVTYGQNEYVGMNLVPFNEILRYDFGTHEFFRQVIGNIILFIPFGYFVTYYVNIKKIGTMFLMSVGVSLIIETVQYFIGRSFDIDDIILNVTGGILGFMLYIALDAIKRHLPSLFQKDFIYTILSILLIVFIVLYFLGIITF